MKSREMGSSVRLKDSFHILDHLTAHPQNGIGSEGIRELISFAFLLMSSRSLDTHNRDYHAKYREEGSDAYKEASISFDDGFIELNSMCLHSVRRRVL